MNKAVITGPSGSGKTTIINKLKRMGYPILPETPKEVMKEGYTGNEKQFEILRRQLKKEASNRFVEFMGQRKGIKEVFLDRGIGDVIGFCDYLNIDIPRIKFSYDKVFYIPHTRKYASFNKRVESGKEEAEEAFYKYILPYYKDAIKLPEENQVEFILKNI